MARRCQAGFTLVEMIVAIVLVGILAAAGSTVVANTMTTAYYAANNQSSHSQARHTAERLARELREIAYGGTGYTIASKSATAMTFTKEDGTLVAITSSGATISLNYNGGTARNITNQVSSFALTYRDQFGASSPSPNNYDIRFVDIAVTMANTKTGQTDSVRTRVFLRNAQASPT